MTQRWLVLATCVRSDRGGGGVVRYATELIRALDRRDDIELTVVAERAAALRVRRIVTTGRVVVPPVALPAALGSAVERWHPESRRGYDVVLGTKHLIPAHSTARRVLAVHDLLLLDRRMDFPPSKRLLLPGPFRRSLAGSDVLLCVSNATRARLALHDPAAADRAAVVPLASASSLLTAPPEPVPKLSGRRFGLVVGDASPRKNVRTLVTAWPAVRDAIPGAVLAFVGPPDWSRSDPDRELDALVASGGAVALGHLPDAQLRWCYEHAGVVLCPSRAEGFGLPAREAVDLGAPLVVSDDAALQEAADGEQLATVPAGHVEHWAWATVEALRRPRPGRTGKLPRTWEEVAADTVEAVRQPSHTLSGAS